MSSGTVTQASSRRPVTAFFRRRIDAEEAIGRLTAAGIAQDCIRLAARDDKRSLQSPGGAGSRPFPEASARLWESLRHVFLPWAKRDPDLQSPRLDGCVLSVSASDADHEVIVAIMGEKGLIKAPRQGKVAVFSGKTPERSER